MFVGNGDFLSYKKIQKSNNANDVIFDEEETLFQRRLNTSVVYDALIDNNF